MVIVRTSGTNTTVFISSVEDEKTVCYFICKSEILVVFAL